MNEMVKKAEEGIPEKYIIFTDFRGYREAVAERLAELDKKIFEFQKAAEMERDELVRIDYENMAKMHKQEKLIQEDEFMQTVGYDECVMQYWKELSDKGIRPKFRLLPRIEKAKFQEAMDYLEIHTYA